MDEYSKEIADLEAQIEQMVEADEDAREIAELQMQADVLKAIYGRAGELHKRGREDSGLRRGLAIRGYGAWTLQNVYAYVYEMAVELPAGGHGAFVSSIVSADFEGGLQQVGAAAEA
jgi:hypothetical protein